MYKVILLKVGENMDFLNLMFGNKWRKTVVILIIVLFIHILAYNVNFIFPNSIVLLFSALILVLLPVFCLKLISPTTKTVFVLISFCLASANWYWISYNSYYNGVSLNLENEANVLYETTANILKSNMSEQEKKEWLYDIFSQSYAEIRVEKDGEPFVFVESKRSKKQYQLESKTKEEQQYIATSSGDYTFNYEYANKPFPWLGLKRAWSFSVFPDFFKSFDNKYYLSNELYNRSITFWEVFIVLCYLGLAIKFQMEQKVKEQEEKNKIVEEKNKAIEEKIKAIEQVQWIEENISNIHKHTFAQIMRDIKDSTTTKAKTVLQDLLVHWNNKKQLADDYEKLYDELDKTSHSIKHDYKHKWTDLNEFYNSNKTDIKPYIDEIINDLNDIPKLLDVRIEKASISEILDKLNEIGFINGTQRKEGGINFTYIKLNPELIQYNEFCAINLERIKSIIYNLITNSVAAINEQKRKYRKDHKRYEGNILLKVNVIELEEKKYLYFSCQDNGGGFPEPDKIYKQEVISSRKNADGSARKGEGTMYIKFFVELYGGKIEGSNYDIELGLRGAKTEIYFPIID